MKKHLIFALVLVSGLSIFSSCMKNDPDNNETVYYAYQQIPNINEYMPQSLLQAFGAEHLYFGDEPPKIEGCYLADSTYAVQVIHAPGSNWSAVPTFIGGTRHFDFIEQHVGTSKLKYVYFDERGDVIEQSTNDSTAIMMRGFMESFLNDSLCPPYFHENGSSTNVFKNAYIIGHDSCFTAYYYDVRSYMKPESQLFKNSMPLYANVISGKLKKISITETDTVSGTTKTIEKKVITNFRWGCQTVRYLKREAMSDIIYNLHSIPKPGDGRIIEPQHVQERND